MWQVFVPRLCERARGLYRGPIIGHKRWPESSHRDNPNHEQQILPQMEHSRENMGYNIVHKTETRPVRV